MHTIATITVLGFFLALGGCSKNGKSDAESPGDSGPAKVEQAAPQRPTLQRKEPLPELARDLLRKYMIEHGDSMESLLWSALMLEHQMTEVVVEQILGQPRLSRPVASEAGDTLNDWLPPRFYELQEQMFTAAEELRFAASKRDDVGTAKSYARLAETCVTCHSLFLSLPSSTTTR